MKSMALSSLHPTQHRQDREDPAPESDNEFTLTSSDEGEV